MNILKYTNILKWKRIKFKNLPKKKYIFHYTLQKYFEMFFKTEFIKKIFKQVPGDTNLKF